VSAPAPPADGNLARSRFRADRPRRRVRGRILGPHRRPPPVTLEPVPEGSGKEEPRLEVANGACAKIPDRGLWATRARAAVGFRLVGRSPSPLRSVLDLAGGALYRQKRRECVFSPRKRLPAGVRQIASISHRAAAKHGRGECFAPTPGSGGSNWRRARRGRLASRG